VALFPAHTHFVFGNCDTDKAALLEAISAIGAPRPPEPYGSLDLEGSRVAFIHGDVGSLMRKVEHSGEYDYLFYGHTHQAEEHHPARTRVINPGALQRARVKTFVVLDLASGALESVVVE